MAIDEGDDEFFYPLDQGEKSRRGGRHSAPLRSVRRGSPLPWLLCAFLLACMAAGLVWVDAPLRAQLQHATQAQQRAMEAVAKLEARSTAEVKPASTLPATTVPSDPVEDEALVWAERMQQALQKAFEAAANTRTLLVTRIDRAVVVQVPFSTTFKAESDAQTNVAEEAQPMWDNVAQALARTLAADESPYRLAVHVPSRECRPAPSAGRSRRRSGGAHRDKQGLSATELAAGRASTLLTWLHGQLAMRPKSSLLASFGPSDAGESTASVELRLERAPE